MKQVVALLLIFFFAGALQSCGTVDHATPSVRIIGPRGVEVEDGHGGRLQSYFDGDGFKVFPNRFLTDSIIVEYGTKSTTVGLEKNLRGIEFLNLLALGLGFVADDMTKTWYYYAPVLVTVDSNARGIQSISATTEERHIFQSKHDRPEALLLCGTGWAWQSNGGASPFPIGSGNFPSPAISLQIGAGIDWYKRFELFYLLRDEPGYPVGYKPDSYSVGIAGADLCLRYFVDGGFFLQGSFGRASAEGFDGSLLLNGSDATITVNPTFTELGAAIGWAGDLSYIALQYFGGTSTFNAVDYNGIAFTNVRYHTVYLNFGLNFRM